jgi:hypothetical protein
MTTAGRPDLTARELPTARFSPGRRWARRVANAVLILGVLMLQCRNVTGESLELPGSFLAR